MDLVKEYSESDLARFSEFLAEAREKCSYESGGEKVKIRKGHFTLRKIGPFNQNGLSYTDIYSGSDWFHGVETISNEKGTLWCRVYNGGITHEKFMKKSASEFIYRGLKKALKEFPKDKPFIRGPEELIIDKFDETHQIRYRDFGVGSFGYFHRSERIEKVKTIFEGVQGIHKIGYDIHNLYDLEYFGGFLLIPQVREAYENQTGLLVA